MAEAVKTGMSKRTKIILIIVAVVVIGAAAAGIWYWNKQKKDAAAEAKKKADEKASIEAETITVQNEQPITESKIMNPTGDTVITDTKEIPLKEKTVFDAIVKATEEVATKEPIVVRPKTVFDNLVEAAIPKVGQIVDEKERSGATTEPRIK